MEKYRVNLTDDERDTLHGLLKEGKNRHYNPEGADLLHLVVGESSLAHVKAPQAAQLA